MDMDLSDPYFVGTIDWADGLPVTSSPFAVAPVKLGQLVLFGIAQLNDASAMAVALGCSAVSDLELLGHAYTRWGAGLADHIDGHFAFAIWNCLDRTLFCCRDIFGTIPFFYHNSPNTFSFASAARHLLTGHDDRRVLNRGALASCVQFFHTKPEGQSLYSPISTLPSATSMVATRSGVSLRRYWRPEIKPELIPSSLDSGVEFARHLTERAVDHRLAGRHSCALKLSGGLDSAVLTAIVSPRLKARGQSLLTLTSVSEVAGRVPDERDFVSMLTKFGNIDSRLMSAEGRGPFDSIGDLAFFEHGPMLNPAHYIDRAMREACGGRDVVLSGALGEYSLTGYAEPIAESLLSFRFAELAQELPAAKALAKVSSLRLIARSLRSHWPALPSQPWVHFNKAFIREFGSVEKIRRWVGIDGRKKRLKRLELFLGTDLIQTTTASEHRAGPMSYPFYDKALVEFCLALPAGYLNHGGNNRYLARAGFSKDLPAAVAWRRSKLPFAPDYFMRYNRGLPKAVEFVRSIRSSDPIREIIDIDLILKLLKPVVPGQRVNTARSSVPRTIYLIHFLRQFPGLRA